MKSQLNVFSRCSALICAIALFSFGSSLRAQVQKPSRAASVLDSMPRAKAISEAVLSPDGTRVACIVEEKLSVMQVGTGVSHPVSVAGNLPLRDVAWSADGKRLAFIADLPGAVPVAQVWTTAPDGGAAVKHVELKGYVQTPRFSPDGSKLAFLFIEGMPRVAGPLQPMTPLAGEINEKIYEQRIATIDLPTDHFAQVTSGDVYVYEYDWSRDGKSWVASAAHGNGDANWWVARLYVVNAQNGEMREIYKPVLQIANPRVSPDGKNVAFIEGLMSDEGSTGGDIYVVPTEGGAAQNLTPNIKASPNALAWTEPDRITFSENVDGNSGFAAVRVRGGAIAKN
jgi:Tol biopolymer transport system component